jgi:hypothetical protein
MDRLEMHLGENKESSKFFFFCFGKFLYINYFFVSESREI